MLKLPCSKCGKRLRHDRIRDGICKDCEHLLSKKEIEKMVKISKSKKIQRRDIYYYPCKGCGKKRQTLLYDRANVGLCTGCRRNQISKNQRNLFEKNI